MHNVSKLNLDLVSVILLMITYYYFMITYYDYLLKTEKIKIIKD